jgi:hypothetical protein
MLYITLIFTDNVLGVAQLCNKMNGPYFTTSFIQLSCQENLKNKSAKYNAIRNICQVTNQPTTSP